MLSKLTKNQKILAAVILVAVIAVVLALIFGGGKPEAQGDQVIPVSGETSKVVTPAGSPSDAATGTDPATATNTNKATATNTNKATATDTNKPKSADKKGTTADWTVYWYLCGSNLESFYSCASNDLAEAMAVKFPDNVRVVIQTGGANTWHNKNVKSGAIQRFLLDKDGLTLIEELPNASMGSANTLSSFMNFCAKNYPSRHKMMLFWNHGGGSVAGAAFDETYGYDALTLGEFASAFGSAGMTFDVIGFDTCLMASIDVANIFKGYGSYMVASEELEPGCGWNYTAWLGALAKNPGLGGYGLGKIICDTYAQGCRAQGMDQEITLSVTDLSKVGALTEAYNALGNEALIQALNDSSFFANMGRRARKTENYGGNTRECGYSNMADLGDLVRNCKEILPSSSGKVLNAVKNCVVYKVNGPYRAQSTGLSCYYSYDGDINDFANYTSVGSSEAFKYLYAYNLTGKLNDAGMKYVKNLGYKGPVKKVEAVSKSFNVSTEEGSLAPMSLDDVKAQAIEAINAAVTEAYADGGIMKLAEGAIGEIEAIDDDGSVDLEVLIATINEIKTSAISDIQRIQLEQAKADAVDAIMEYSSDFASDEVRQLIDEAITSIREAENINAVETAKELADAAINEQLEKDITALNELRQSAINAIQEAMEGKNLEDMAVEELGRIMSLITDMMTSEDIRGALSEASKIVGSDITLNESEPTGGDTPGGDTPGGDTPGGDTPGTDGPYVPPYVPPVYNPTDTPAQDATPTDATPTDVEKEAKYTDQGLLVVPSLDQFNIKDELDTYVNDSGFPEMRISPELMDALSAVRVSVRQLFVESEDPLKISMIDWGESDLINTNWKDGVVNSWFSGYWAALDGVALRTEIMYESDDYTLYSAPILLNGEICNMHIAYEKNISSLDSGAVQTDFSWHILGARRVIDTQTGMGEKYLIKLKPGDEIIPLYRVWEDITDTEGQWKYYSQDDNKVIYEDESQLDLLRDFGRATYEVRYELVDSRNQVTYSDSFIVDVYDDVVISQLEEEMFAGLDTGLERWR